MKTPNHFAAARYHLFPYIPLPAPFSSLSQLGPIYLHYRWVQVRNNNLHWLTDEEAEAKYEELNDLYAPVVEALCYR